ncbi:kinase-like domain-containing protein [Boletus edulis BED1]|uniref:Kinase-like domain-containing protein n=1 Tax=Boletus edulis BED1 TaxID=1328754 RepID=A0AAD4BRP0_BOLED|nr:kinase-like domain-containing protein [Boletus edulis BED1]
MMHASNSGCFPNDLTDRVTREGHDPVASGGFADIYRGVLQDNGQSIRVAIKAIKTYSGEDVNLSKKKKRLWREIKVWLDLRHDNVLPLLGTSMGFGRFPAMVCPWVENGVLTSYLEGRYSSLSVIEILGLLNSVASGLQYLHSRSVVHGDLSGSNVLIHEGGRACITDFGLSMLLTELGASTFATSFHARGTLRWMAPELLDLEVPKDDVVEDSSRVGPTTQSDVYSFGSIMLQILSGKPPYHYYKREGQVLHAISKGMMPERPGTSLVTEGRWLLIQRCWSTVDITRSRPSSEEILEFIEQEHAHYQSWEFVTYLGDSAMEAKHHISSSSEARRT